MTERTVLWDEIPVEIKREKDYHGNIIDGVTSITIPVSKVSAPLPFNIAAGTYIADITKAINLVNYICHFMNIKLDYLEIEDSEGFP